jgi:TfoX/Sxy family transcriptional regulator of competence genes
MAYDEELAGRIRELLVTEDVVEKRMFGGLAFLVRGNMSVSASGRGGLLVRIDPDETEEAIARPHVKLMEMGKRTMRGWIHVPPEALEEDGALEEWVERGVSYASSLPAK